MEKGKKERHKSGRGKEGGGKKEKKGENTF